MKHDCDNEAMRDLLPGYVHRRLSAAERSAVAAHLQTCAGCAAEVELIAAASRAFPGPEIDTGRIVKALPPAPRASAGAAFAGQAWRLAAAIGIIAIGAFTVVALRGFFHPAPRQAASSPAPAAGKTVAVVTPAPAVHDSPVRVVSPVASAKPLRSSISFGGGLSDLSDDQLDTLLGELDALQALPSAEPETHLSPIVPPADGGHSAR